MAAIFIRTALPDAAFGRELRRREAMQAELERLSLTDALTGLPNRRAFENAGTQAWEADRRSGKESAAPPRPRRTHRLDSRLVI